MKTVNGIVADGFWRARAALKPHVRLIVETEYAERLAVADDAEKTQLLREMQREIRRRVRAQSPWYGLY
ncbi:hypothetical protein GC163_18605 [bacterium]|nr:hypothetical protein [bacterium]